MSKVSDTFTSQALSIQDTFLLHNSNVGYRVPIYQRGYRWNEENIFRLFESILHGIVLLDEDSSIRFIGTIILSSDKEKKEKEFGGISLSIVDGQQRLSTISLIICRLMNQIMLNLKKVDNLSDELSVLLNSLRSCIVGRKNSTIIRSYLSEFYPRLVRESIDARGHTPLLKKYDSFIAEYLFSFGSHYYDFISGDLDYNDFDFTISNAINGIEDQEFFKKAINHIDIYIARIASGKSLTDDSDNEIFPSTNKLLNDDNYTKVLESCGFSIGTHNLEGLSDPLLRIIFFSGYLLNNVSLTCVQVEDDKYVFDIFDALNTTGEPLTAIETFKPEVIKFIEDRKDITGDFSSSNSRLFFDEIDKYLSMKTENSKRQKETKEIITSFALYINGDTQNYDLSGQRLYLRNKYALIPLSHKSYEKKERFVKALRDIAIYREKFWEESSLTNSLPEIKDHQERQKILLCLDFIRSMDTTLAIPILARYYFDAEKTKSWDIFIKAVKSVTAFLAIRRAATGTTAGIDSDFRNLMKKGHKKLESKHIKLGLLDDNELASPEELNVYLLSYLDSPKLGTNKNKILDEESWTNKVVKQPLYDKSKALCKFLLLVASHNSIEGTEKKYILSKEGRDNCNFLELTKWRDHLYQTVEHIAPQNARDQNTKGLWKDELYNDIDTIHTIGNLILLPKLENTIIGNKPWPQKKMFFKAFAQEDQKEIPKVIEEAKEKAIPFSAAAIKAINDGKYMPLISSITDIDDWNIDVVTERGKNICHLAWHELSRWLGIVT
ncbi:DUF262 domain-containing protein [Thiothrix subterranea]|uniref:DUF262 domain-containing HNH endonuclease family protein n=1 Tax=Thiothrix subterranea TaxID=2735563 RepID=A0AA51MP13_9GAMM|nr:DUF262 domain-containing HNH endonuclease family protein [Thiothrix subterranea]MDQ5767256.1 DUF262 domain-containing HNH endonuclease family protein [Thiothrix subterranea]WML87882.1 DUF262 domain-containing HNH endonuclease family protein [Thiothrix subterranea]